MAALVPLLIFMSIILLLAALAAYDLKHYILPDKLNLALAIACLLLHVVTRWTLLSPVEAVAGAAASGGLLLLVRAAARKYYGEDALGLGDVKLMAAAGIGLGFPHVLLALSWGAGIGLVHGLVMGARKKKRGEKVDLSKINVPAGLGLCAGVVIVMVMQFGAELVK
jgi:leader peptidase (prepilin peptidase)/N-methyltransferase